MANEPAAPFERTSIEGGGVGVEDHNGIDWDMATVVPQSVEGTGGDYSDPGLDGDEVIRWESP
jgi:hypothetical protein